MSFEELSLVPWRKVELTETQWKDADITVEGEVTLGGEYVTFGGEVVTW